MSFGKCQKPDASYTNLNVFLVAMKHGIFFMKLVHDEIWSITLVRDESEYEIYWIKFLIFLMYFQAFSIFERFWGSLCLNIKMESTNLMLHIPSWPIFRKTMPCFKATRNTFKVVYEVTSFWHLPTDILYYQFCMIFKV